MPTSSDELVLISGLRVRDSIAGLTAGRRGKNNYEEM